MHNPIELPSPPPEFSAYRDPLLLRIEKMRLDELEKYGHDLRGIVLSRRDWYLLRVSDDGLARFPITPLVSEGYDALVNFATSTIHRGIKMFPAPEGVETFPLRTFIP